MKIISENKCFSGTQMVCQHRSSATGTEMTFGVFKPQQSEAGKVPVLWYLSGLTCTHENAMVKAGAQAFAAKQGLMLVFPDTSPRGDMAADDDEYDLGQGAGFYVDATEEPWAQHFQMYSYIRHELPKLLVEHFPANMDRQGITGHSMGGHGALTLAMQNPDIYRSVSAFSPICNPSSGLWGPKQLGAYLGEQKEIWQQHDASCLMADQGWAGDILVDQGANDQFLDFLNPDALFRAAEQNGIDLKMRMQEGYDHSYFFVSTFMEDHIAWHAERLKR